MTDIASTSTGNKPSPVVPPPSPAASAGGTA
jgi:hypothetical protein